jgi:hypothetical protein
VSGGGTQAKEAGEFFRPWKDQGAFSVPTATERYAKHQGTSDKDNSSGAELTKAEHILDRDQRHEQAEGEVLPRVCA